MLFTSHTLDFSAGGTERVFHKAVARIDRTKFVQSVFVGGDAYGIPQEYANIDVPIEATETLILHAEKNLIRLLQTTVSIVAFALWRKLAVKSLVSHTSIRCSLSISPSFHSCFGVFP